MPLSRSIWILCGEVVLAEDAQLPWGGCRPQKTLWGFRGSGAALHEETPQARESSAQSHNKRWRISLRGTIAQLLPAWSRYRGAGDHWQGMQTGLPWPRFLWYPLLWTRVQHFCGETHREVLLQVHLVLLREMQIMWDGDRQTHL